jgi:acetyl-CoA carboxylase carboxyltransferase component
VYSILAVLVSAIWLKGKGGGHVACLDHKFESFLDKPFIDYFVSLTRSKAGLPSVAVVFGSSTAGGAYIPGMSDYVVMVKVKYSLDSYRHQFFILCSV